MAELMTISGTVMSVRLEGMYLSHKRGKFPGSHRIRLIE